MTLVNKSIIVFAKKEGIIMKKKILLDVILNIVATAIPLLVLQLISLPVVAHRMGSDGYGIVITLISLFTLLSIPFGNSLNNIRLLLNEEYKGKNLIGDFNILLVWSLIISSFLMFIGVSYFIESFSIINTILTIFIACLILIREYLMVSFRIKLNYQAILINNIILGLGYLLGTYLFYLTGYWHLIYIVGSTVSLFYIIKNSNLIKEPFFKTYLFKKTSYKSLILFVSTFLKTLLSYADKLLLFPLLGPHVVSVYYTATVFGKIIAMAITPINSVVLSYLTRIDRLEKRKLVLLIGIIGSIGFIGYFIIILISKPLLYLLYPNWAEQSFKLIYITSGTAIVEVMSSIIHPFILRFKNINWQILINGSSVIVYIVCTLMFYSQYGLLGFCLGVLISSVYKLIIMTLIFFISKVK